jgi:uncharacterized protein (TIGR00299 family) protein
MQRLDRIHLDPVGGIAGDMFAAALADAFPEAVPGLLAELAKLGAREGAVRIAAHSDGIVAGSRFVVENDKPRAGPHTHEEGHGEMHAHVPYPEVRERLHAARLEPAVLHHAEALFDLLAAAESEVHGIAKEEVEFHEVGAWDSIVDFVAAAYFIARLEPRVWTFSPPPLGGGRVATAHGLLPVPAPATVRLLQGLEVIDDGVAGERVTPTGAAILRHLAQGRAPEAGLPRIATLAASGTGHGTRALAGIPNVLRCLAFGAARRPADGTDEVAALQFEIDDQTAEDLAVALDRVRATPGVLEVYQAPVFGKKGRLATQVQVLAHPDAAERVAELCLAETATLGLRIARLARRTLARRHSRTADGVRVKLAARPDGALSAKAEMDDLARAPGARAGREAARERAEREALGKAAEHGHGARDDD